MTREHLLEAMGFLDDDLIKEAEEPVRRKKWNREAWLSLAACLAVVLTIGYGMAQNGGWSANSSSGSASAGATMEDWAGASGGENAASSGTATAPQEAESGNASSGSGQSGEALILMVPVEGQVYAYQHRYDQDRVLDTLPEGCRSLGRVEAYGEGENTPYTDGDAFLGSQLWIAGEGWDGPVYLKTAEGAYLECAWLETR